MGKEKNNNFVVQAGILAFAGILSRVIGLLYRSPLHRVIGAVGLGFYQSAYAFYTIVLLVSSYSIPAAISKVIAQKLAVGEYKNAHRIFRFAMCYVLVIGTFASILLFFGAGIFVEESAVPVLRVFAPTIFLYGILGVLRGYFQAHSSMLQTSVSQIIEQIANAIVSVGAAYLLIRFSMGTMSVPESMAGQIKRGIFGAMGSAMGTGMGVFSALIVMLIFYVRSWKKIHERIENDEKHQILEYRRIFLMITMTVTPFILSTAIYNLSSSVNTKIYTGLYKNWSGVSTLEIQTVWGLFSGQALTISNIPIAFASAMATAMIPSIATMIAAGDRAGARSKIGIATKVTMLISIPCAAGMFALAQPVTSLLFHDNSDELLLAGKLLMALSLSVIFYALSTLNSSILQGAGKVTTPIVNAGIALVIQTVCVIGLLLFTHLGIYSVAIANSIYSFAMCVLNQRSTRLALGYKQEIKRTFLIPCICSVIMGGIAYCAYRGLLSVVHSSRIAVLPAIAIAIPAYFVLMIVLKGVTEEELLQIPKGHLIIRLGKKIHMM